MVNDAQVLAFALVLLRVSAFTVSWPLFSLYSLPNYLKILFAVGIAMVIFPVVNRSGLSAKMLDHDIAWLAGKEVLTGLCLGFMTRLFFFAISCGGNLIATSSGLANGQLFNPALGASTTTVEQFYGALGTLLFLSLDGHHFFLTGLVKSFDAIPLAFDGTSFALSNSHGVTASAFDHMIGKFGESGVILERVTEAGIKIAAPVLLAIFVLNIMMGIVSRAVPQVNILVTSMSVNFMSALLVMVVAIPALILQLDHELMAFTELLFKFMKAN